MCVCAFCFALILDYVKVNEITRLARTTRSHLNTMFSNIVYRMKALIDRISTHALCYCVQLNSTVGVSFELKKDPIFRSQLQRKWESY